MWKQFLNSWKTTALGLALGGLNLWANGLGWKQVLISVGLTGLGILTKDFNVTVPPVIVAAPPVAGVPPAWGAGGQAQQKH